MIDTRLPLAVQQPNFLGAMQEGTQLAGNTNALRRVAEMQNLYREQGPGIASGDPGAMNALARFDPTAAFNMGQQREQGQRAERSLGVSEAQLGMAREAAARAVREAQDQQATALEVQRAQEMFKQAVFAFEAGDEQAWNKATGEFGAQLPMDEGSVRLLGATIGGAAQEVSNLYQPQERKTVNVDGVLYEVPSEGDVIPLTERQEDAGIFGPGGMSVETPDGTRVQMGGGIERADLSRGSGEVRIPSATSPTGTEIIPEPGSQAARDADAAENAAAGAAQNEQTRQNVVSQTTAKLRQILDKPNSQNKSQRGIFDLPEVGIIGSRLTGINQEAADVAGLLDTLKGMVAFDRLDKLRQASANGASGLGQVTEREIALLAAQLGALDQSLSKPLLKSTLDTIDEVFSRLSPDAQDYLTGATDSLSVGARSGSLQGQGTPGPTAPTSPGASEAIQRMEDDLRAKYPQFFED